jgi:transcriptional regulator with XRE-family HTH domain
MKTRLPSAPGALTVRQHRQRFTGSRIRQVREEMQLTQLELAKKLGFRSDRSLSEIERGINSIDPHVLLILSRLSGYDMRFFVDPSYTPALRIRPLTLSDWQALYPDQPERARIHWEIDRHFERAESLA